MGDQPADLRKLAFVLMASKAVQELGSSGRNGSLLRTQWLLRELSRRLTSTGNKFRGQTMECGLHFESGLEASVSRKTSPRASYIFSLEEGSDPTKIIDTLKAANPQCIVEQLGPSSLSVVLPPAIKMGDQPVDLRKLAFVLIAGKAVQELGLQGEMETCCGHNGCCANQLHCHFCGLFPEAKQWHALCTFLVSRLVSRERLRREPRIFSPSKKGRIRPRSSTL